MTAAVVPPTALILSIRHAGGVQILASLLRERGLRPVLLSEFHDDHNAQWCDGHITVDWSGGDRHGTLLAIAEWAPAAVVNFAEPLIEWQIAIAEAFSLRGATPGLTLLVDKSAVRHAMSQAGLSRLNFAAGTPIDLLLSPFDDYPAIVKPSRDSGGSRGVRLVESRADLPDVLGDLADRYGTNLGLILEPYIEGTEFTLDGLVTGHVFRAILEVEKVGHDNERHHDSGILMTPMPTVDRATVRATELLLSDFCRAVDIDEVWLHVEARAGAAGIELIEINPRPGGGMYRSATLRATGMDPVIANLDAALGRTPMDQPPARVQLEGVLGNIPFEAFEPGRFAVEVSTAEIVDLEGVVDASFLSEIVVDDLDRENFFGFVLLEASNRESLSVAAEELRKRVTLRRIDNTSDKDQK